MSGHKRFSFIWFLPLKEGAALPRGRVGLRQSMGTCSDARSDLVLDCSALALWTSAAHACRYTHLRATFTVMTQKLFQTLLFRVFITFLVKQSIVSKSVCTPPEFTRMPAAPSPASLGGFRQPASVERSPSANSLQVFCQIWAYFHFSPDAGMHLPSC